MPQQLRFAIMFNGKVLERWQAKCVQTLLGTQGVKLGLVINESASLGGQRSSDSSNLLFRIYCLLFVRPPALASFDPRDLVSNTPSVSCQTVQNRGPLVSLRDDPVEEIRKYDLDFILRFGYGILESKALDVARYGIWTFRFGDIEGVGGNPPGFWEIYRGDAVTAAALVRTGDEPGSIIVLRKGFFRTQSSSYSRNLQLFYPECSRWPMQVCRDILSDNADYLTLSRSIDHRSVGRPSKRQTLRFSSITVANRLRSFYHALFRYSFWNIGVVSAPIEKFIDPDFRPRIAWLSPPPKGEFKADPFGMPGSPAIQIFYENLDYHAPKGIIYTVQVREGAFAGQPQKIIELPVHMSYPYLVTHKGNLYCVPETNRAREISVYKSTRFPDEWERTRTLLSDVMAIDTTIFQHDGLWWMMFTDREKGGDANLYVWYAPDFLGPWRPHTNNPVKSDVRSARPGGTPFYHEDVLYRPAQDCSKTGGGRTVINRVKRLSPDLFEEEVVAVVEPDRMGPYPEGLHTISKVGDLTLVDGKKFEFSFVGFLNNIAKGVRRTIDRE